MALNRRDNQRVIRAPRGTALNARSWQTEAPLRMLMNNLDSEVAESPQELVVYGGIGRAARDWRCYDVLVETLKRLEDDETLCVQSGKPVGVFRTHPDAPRVLIANSNLVAHWATWDKFHQLDRIGLMMYGQMTAGSWIYIGSQGIIQGTYETFAECGRQHYSGDLSGKWILTGGLGGMGGAQPLAATMAGASLLAVECRASRIERRLQTRYLDRMATDLDEALAIIERSCAEKKPVSVGLVGNTAEIYPELVRRGIRPDIVTDQTAAHDPLNGYLPAGWTLEQWEKMQGRDPTAVERAAKESMAVQVRAMLDFHRRGVPTLDYGNNIRQFARETGVSDAFDFPGFVPADIRPMFCRGRGPFRWAALSGDPEDIYRTDAKVKELFPDDAHLHNWLDLARERIAFQGLPARICWLGLGERARAGLAFNDMVASGELKAPVVIGRDHLDSGSVASPEPRDRGHEGRLGCGGGLAVPERHAERRLRRHLGLDPPRRRRRHRLLAACRHGDRVRWHPRDRTPPRARAGQRSGDRGHAPRRRRIRGRDRLRARARPQAADARRLSCFAEAWSRPDFCCGPTTKLAELPPRTRLD